MLKVGQYVTIEMTPRSGRYFFEDANIGLTTRVVHIYQPNGGVPYYRLAGCADECLWVESELQPHDNYFHATQNKFDVGETVMVDDEEYIITRAYKNSGGFAYELNGIWHVQQHKLKSVEPMYTLF